MIKRILVFLCLSAGAWAQSTTTVTGTIKNLGTGNVSSGTFVRFWLRGCAGNLPRINGTGIIAPTLGNVFYFDMVPNSSGVISGTLYSTRDSTGLLGGAIECGGSTTAVWYGYQPYLNGKAGPETPIAAKASATIDISNITPLTTNPVITAPTGDSTYLRLDAGNGPLSAALAGPFSVTGTGSFSGNETVGGTLGVTGATTLSSLNTIIFADQQSGADMCAKIITAATAIQNGTTTASTILVPAGSFACTSQLLFPNDGGSPPKQKAIKLIGAGAGGLADNNSGVPNGGTTLDLQFTASSTGKIDTRGLGKLEVTGFNFKDSTTDCTPFVFDTNTVISFHDNQFLGNSSCTTKQDVFILGGSTNTIGGGATAAFQGYGTTIFNNQADCIGRFAFLDVFANAINIIHNGIFGCSGLTTGNGAAIELNPATSVVNGNQIIGNLCEVTGYVYCINLVKSASFNTISGNNCFDHGASTLACVHVVASASNFGNQIIDGNADTTIPPITGNGPSLGLFTAANQCALHTQAGSSDLCSAAELSSGALQFSNGFFMGSGQTFTGGDIGPSLLVAGASAAQTFTWGCNGTATSSSSSLTLSTVTSTSLACTDTSGLGIFTMPSAGEISNLQCFANTGGHAAGSGVMTVRKGGVGQALTCTFGTGTSCSDNTAAHNFAVAAGNLLTIAYTTQSTETLASIACSVEKH